MRESEIIRYLGYRGTRPDERVLDLVHQCMAEIESVSQPKSIARRFEVKLFEDNIIETAGMRFRSANLSKNLRGCGEVYLFAATLGNEADRLLEKYMKLQLSKAAVMQAAAAEAIESYCNECQSRLEKEAEAEGFFLRPRFSPGYGDLELSLQGEFLRILNTQKTIGLILSEGSVMIPEKSVTAFIGIGKNRLSCSKGGCSECTKTDCAFRLE